MPRSFPGGFTSVITADPSSLRLLIWIKMPTSGTPVYLWSTSDYTHSYGGNETGSYGGMVLRPGSYDQVADPDPMEGRVGRWEMALFNAGSPVVSSLFKGSLFTDDSVDYLDTEVIITTPELLEGAFNDGELDAIYAGDDFDTLRAGLDEDSALFIGFVEDVPSYSETECTIILTDAGGRFGKTFGTLVTTSTYAQAAPSALGHKLPQPIGKVNQLRFLPTVSGRRATLAAAVAAPPSLKENESVDWTVDQDVSAWGATGLALVIPAGAREVANLASSPPRAEAWNFPFVISWRARSANALHGVRWKMLSGAIGPIDSGSVILEIPSDEFFRWNADETFASLAHVVDEVRIDGAPPLEPDELTVTNGGSGVKPEIAIPLASTMFAQSRRELEMTYYGTARAGDMAARPVECSLARDEWAQSSPTIHTGGGRRYMETFRFPALDYLESLAGEVDLEEMEFVQVLSESTGLNEIIGQSVMRWPPRARTFARTAASGGAETVTIPPSRGSFAVSRKDPINAHGGSKRVMVMKTTTRPSRLPRGIRSRVPYEYGLRQGDPADPGQSQIARAVMKGRLRTPDYVFEDVISPDTALPLSVTAGANQYEYFSVAFSDYSEELQAAEVAELYLEVELVPSEFEYENHGDDWSGLHCWDSLLILLGAARQAGGGTGSLANLSGVPAADEKELYLLEGQQMGDLLVDESGASSVQMQDRRLFMIPFKADLLRAYGADINILLGSFRKYAGEASNTCTLHTCYWKFRNTKRYSGKVFEASTAVESLGDYAAPMVTADVDLQDGAGATVENPATVIETFGTDIMSLAAHEVDSAGTFNDAETRFDALAYAFSGAFDDPTQTMLQALQQMCNECRSLYSWETRLRLIIREDSGDLGAVSDTIVKGDVPAEKLAAVRFSKDLKGFTSQRVQLRFHRDYALGRSVEAYRQIASQGYGNLERAHHFAADFIGDSAAMAADVATFFSARHGARAKTFPLPLKIEFLKLLAGDLLSINWLDGDGAAWDDLDGTPKFEVMDVDLIFTRKDAGLHPYVEVTFREAV